MEGISICLTAYNADKFIKETLDSIKTQTYFKHNDNYEVLVGVDGCIKTYNYLKTIANEYDSHFRFFMMQSNRGTYITSNTLMGKMAKYDRVLRFDSDDLMNPDCIETLMSKDCDFIRLRMSFFASNGYELKRKDDFYTGYGQFFIKTQLFRKFGGYMPWICNADFEFYKRIKKFTKEYKLLHSVMKRRMHGENMTIRKETSIKSKLRKTYYDYIDNVTEKITKEEEAIIKLKTCDYKEFSDIRNDVIVNITTWHMRDKYLPKMLEYFGKQSYKNYKVFLWLAKDEYDVDNLPAHIKKLETDGVVEIKWVDKNIYCHKRSEVFKEYFDCYNVFADDDILYPTTLLSDFLNETNKYPDCVTSYYGYIQNYIGVERVFSPFKNTEPSFKDTFLGGCCIFPPFVFPSESFEYSDDRDKLTPVCDESWIVPWLIKKGVKTHCIQDRTGKTFKAIGDSQNENVAVWKQIAKKENGVRKKEKYFANVIKFLNIEEKVLSIWPKFNIDKCSDYEPKENNKTHSQLKLHGMTLVYNESKMIPYIMPYYERLGYDKLIVYDNESTDNTVELLKKYPFVEIRTFSTNGKKDNSVQRDLKNNIFKEYYGKNNVWLTISDFDEVLYYDGNFKEYLASKDSEGYNYLNQCMVNIISKKFPDISDNSLVHDKCKLGCFWDDLSGGYKMTLFKPSVFKKIDYTPGSHKVMASLNDGIKPKSLNNLDIKSFHIKYIDYDFNFEKTIKAKNHRSANDVNRKYGTQYEKLSDKSEYDKFWNGLIRKSFELCDYISGKKSLKNGIDTQCFILRKCANEGSIRKINVSKAKPISNILIKKKNTTNSEVTKANTKVNVLKLNSNLNLFKKRNISVIKNIKSLKKDSELKAITTKEILHNDNVENTKAHNVVNEIEYKSPTISRNIGRRKLKKIGFKTLLV